MCFLFVFVFVAEYHHKVNRSSASKLNNCTPQLIPGNRCYVRKLNNYFNHVVKCCELLKYSMHCENGTRQMHCKAFCTVKAKEKREEKRVIVSFEMSPIADWYNFASFFQKCQREGRCLQRFAKYDNDEAKIWHAFVILWHTFTM